MTDLIDRIAADLHALHGIPLVKAEDCARAALALVRREDRTREAFLRFIQLDNGCRLKNGEWNRRMRPADAPPCEGAPACACAMELDSYVQSLPSPPDTTQGER